MLKTNKIDYKSLIEALAAFDHEVASHFPISSEDLKEFEVEHDKVRIIDFGEPIEHIVDSWHPEGEFMQIIIIVKAFPVKYLHCLLKYILV